MRRYSILLSLATVVSVFQIATWSGEPEDNQEDAIIADVLVGQRERPPFDGADEAAEIREIRGRIGPPLFSDKHWHDPRETNDGEFDSALTELMSKRKASGAESYGSGDSQTPIPDEDRELIQALRKTSELLDTKANHLEQRRGYPVAESYRRLSKRLRKVARQLDVSRISE